MKSRSDVTALPVREETSEERTVGRSVLLGALTLGLLARLSLAFNDDGLYWPDEVFQSLEPAHRLVFGYGLVAWEFVQGARTWALPALVAPWMALARLLGLEQPEHYLGMTRVFFVLIGVATGAGTYWLARRLGTRPLFAAAGAALFLLAPPAIYFAPRALSETASTALVVFGVGWAWPPTAFRRERLLGAALLGLSVLFRLQNALFCVVLLAAFSGRRQWRAAAEALGMFAFCALLLGVLDRVTWGGFFHSALVYIRFNLVEGKASLWGESPPHYYVRVLFTSMPWLVLATAGWVGLGWRRAPGLLGGILFFLAAHSLIPHKEYRFVFAALPLLFALAGGGMQALGERWVGVKPLAIALAATALAAGSALRLPRLTFGELGHYETLKPTASALDDFGPLNRMLLVAHDQGDLCGLKLEASHIAWSGGYSYLHRKVPFYPHFGPPRQSGLYNYVITLGPPGVELPGKVAQDGPFVLVRLGGSCRPDPSFSDRLP